MESLKKLIPEKTAFLKAEEPILRKALTFYKLGFTPNNISSAQISAISSRIQRESSIDEAKRKICEFIDKQIKKLEKKEKNGKKKSWLREPASADRAESLGAALKDWIENEKYMPEGAKASDINTLSALRRFWGGVSVFHSYKKNMHKGMPLNEDLI